MTPPRAEFRAIHPPNLAELYALQLVSELLHPAVLVPDVLRARIHRFVFAVVGLRFVAACASIPAKHQAVDAVTIEGAHKLDTGDIEDKLATAPSPKFLGLFRGLVYDYEIYDRLTVQRDLARVERYYRARGFYDAHARVARVIRPSPDHVRVEIVVEEGAPVRVRSVRVEGVHSLPQALRELLLRRAGRALKKGALFDEDDLDASVNTVGRTLLDSGYARERVVRDVTVDVVARAADVVLTVTPGERAVFGKVRVDGLGGLPSAPVLRAVDIAEGEPYSQTALESARQAVLDLGVFSAAEVTPEMDVPGGSPGIVPVVVHVEPSALRAVRLGGGVELDAIKTDVHAVIGWESHNFFGGMRAYHVTFQPGVVLYPLRIDHWVAPERLLPEFRLTNDFRQPGFIEARTNGLLRAELNLFPVLLPNVPQTSDSVPGYLEFKASAGADRTLWKLYTSLNYNFQIEKPFSYHGATDPALRTLFLSFPELVTNLDFADSRVEPHRGVFIGNSVQVAGGPFGGDATDVRVHPDLRGYVPLGRRATLAMRGSLGFLFPLNYGSSLRDTLAEQETDAASRIKDLQIIFFRGFFAGGPNSDRGYPLRSIGPYQVVASPAFGGSASISACALSSATSQECRIPVGGTTIWEASAEARFTVSGPFSMATFCDAADVSPTVVDIRFSHPHLSCGVGGRYDTPVGPVRLDVGYRIPGVQVLPRPDPTEPEPDPLFGVLPIAIAFGIGEAY